MATDSCAQVRERRKTRIVQALGIELRRQGMSGLPLNLPQLAEAVDKVV